MCLAKPRPRLLDKRAIKLAKEREWLRVKQVVKKRDEGRCRICRKPGHEVHHVVMRSLGGKDEARNLVLVCRSCHTEIHGHVLKVWGAASDLQWERITA